MYTMLEQEKKYFTFSRRFLSRLEYLLIKFGPNKTKYLNMLPRRYPLPYPYPCGEISTSYYTYEQYKVVALFSICGLEKVRDHCDFSKASRCGDLSFTRDGEWLNSILDMLEDKCWEKQFDSDWINRKTLQMISFDFLYDEKFPDTHFSATLITCVNKVSFDYLNSLIKT